MRKFVLASAALAALTVAGSAMAADLPAEPAYKSAPLIVPTNDWTGFYIGVNAGYSWGNSSNTYTVTGVTTFAGSAHMGGDVVGGQAGYNWQVNRNWVVGIEADLQGTNQKGTDTPAPISTTSCTPFFGQPLCTTTVTGVSMDQTLRWFGTARARFGFVPWDHLMLFVTGGAAYGEISSTATATVTTSGTFGGTPLGAPTTALATAHFVNRRAGWTVGGGAEWVLSGPWTAKLEYLFMDLGSYSNTVPSNSSVPSTLISSHVTDNIVRVGLNYRFGGPVVARY